MYKTETDLVIIQWTHILVTNFLLSFIPVGYITDITINENVTGTEGAIATAECIVDAVSITGNIEYEWKLNDVIINPTKISRLQVLDSKITSTKYNSTLVIENLKRQDKGWYHRFTYFKNVYLYNIWRQENYSYAPPTIVEGH